jgi:hypothetical protein
MEPGFAVVRAGKQIEEVVATKNSTRVIFLAFFTV